MKEFNSQVCTTKEQSQRLLDLGLKPETADMCHYLSNPQDAESPYTRLVLEDYIYIHLGEEGWEDAVPAWSLHRLIELMDVYEVILEWKFGIYECVISMLEERIKDGLINKEYLKQ